MAAARILAITQRGYEAEAASDVSVRQRHKVKSARERSTSEMRQKQDKEALQRRKSDDDLLVFNRSPSVSFSFTDIRTSHSSE